MPFKAFITLFLALQYVSNKIAIYKVTKARFVRERHVKLAGDTHDSCRRKTTNTSVINYSPYLQLIKTIGHKLLRDHNANDAIVTQYIGVKTIELVPRCQRQSRSRRHNELSNAVVFLRQITCLSTLNYLFANRLVSTHFYKTNMRKNS